MFDLILSTSTKISFVLSIIAIIGGTIGASLAITNAIIMKRKRKTDVVNNVKIKDGVRYTTGKNVLTKNGEVLITHNEQDIILELGVKYIVTKDSAIIPGKYAVLSTNNSIDKFNIRIGGLVREVEHCGNIVLAEGAEITAVSHAVILR